MSRSNRCLALTHCMAGFGTLVVLLVFATLAATPVAGVEQIKKGKQYDLKVTPKAKVRFTVESKGRGSVWPQLWYETVSPNKDGKKVWTDVARLCINDATARRTFGPYEIPQGPCQFALNQGSGKLEVQVHVEVSERKPDGSYGPFNTALKIEAIVTDPD